MAKVVVRPAAPAHAELLAPFTSAVFAHTYGAAIPPAALAAYTAREFTAERMAADLADPALHHMLAWQGAALAGVCRMLVAPPPVGQLAAPLEISRFYVAPAWHGTGVAAQLLDAALGLAQRLDRQSLWLCVWEHNRRALAFYQRHGFRPIGTVAVHVDATAFDDLVLARGVAGDWVTG